MIWDCRGSSIALRVRKPGLWASYTNSYSKLLLKNACNLFKTNKPYSQKNNVSIKYIYTFLIGG